MIADANKGLRLRYNYLNLPTEAIFIGGGSIKWEYSAAGAKMSKTVKDANGEVIKIRTYAAGFVYERYTDDGDDQLQFFTTETGRARLMDQGRIRLEHDLTDHLGNVRLTFTKNDEHDPTLAGSTRYKILQKDAYYPFGLKMAGLSEATGEENKFTYNGKELADEHGLNWYHYGARFYDPQLGRWHAVDPADEFFSPYIYVGNNPINLIDPDGTTSNCPDGPCDNFLQATFKYFAGKIDAFLQLFKSEQTVVGAEINLEILEADITGIGRQFVFDEIGELVDKETALNMFIVRATDNGKNGNIEVGIPGIFVFDPKRNNAWLLTIPINKYSSIMYGRNGKDKYLFGQALSTRTFGFKGSPSRGIEAEIYHLGQYDFKNNLIEAKLKSDDATSNYYNDILNIVNGIN